MKQQGKNNHEYALIVFKDGSFTVETFGQKPFYAGRYQYGARLFGVDQRVKISDLSFWLGQNMEAENKRFVEYDWLIY